MVSSKQGEMRRVAGTQGGGDVLDDTSQEKVLSSSFSLMSSERRGRKCNAGLTLQQEGRTAGKGCNYVPEPHSV